MPAWGLCPCHGLSAQPWAPHTLPQPRSEAPPLPASSRQPRVTCSSRGPAEGCGSRAELSCLHGVTAWRWGLVWVPGAGLTALVSKAELQAGPSNPRTPPHPQSGTWEWPPQRTCQQGAPLGWLRGTSPSLSHPAKGGRVLDSELCSLAGPGHGLQLEPPAFPPGLALGASSLGLPGRRLAPYFSCTRQTPACLPRPLTPSGPPAIAPTHCQDPGSKLWGC